MASHQHEVLASVRLSLEDILGEMLKLKQEGNRKADLCGLATDASVLFLELRKVNRLIFQEEDRVKLETEAAKVPVDSTALSLHNLLYEKNHYLKAISACRDYKSKYPAVELVPVEEFFRDAPEEMKSDPAIATDNHKLMLQRLHFELYQRKRLCRKRESLEAHKKRLQECIAARKKFMSTLPAPLKGLTRATMSVQQLLGIPSPQPQSLDPSTDMLPTPLYLLYSQLLAQRDTFGENTSVEIVGSARDAQGICRQLARREADGVKGDDMPDKGDHDRRSRSHRKSKSGIAPPVDMYRSHPLRISLSIFDDEPEHVDNPRSLVTVVFDHLSKLNVVCAGIESAQCNDPEDLLARLYPGDDGLKFPNQASRVVAGAEFPCHQKPGLRPYKWAQQISGIDCLPEVPPLLSGTATSNGHGPATHSSRVSVNSMIKLLRRQAKGQIELGNQAQDMEIQ